MRYSRAMRRLILGVVALVIVVGTLFWLGEKRHPPVASRRESARRSEVDIEPAGAVSPSAPHAQLPERPTSADQDGAAPPAADPLGGGGTDTGSWDYVDLDKIRAALPENLYWKMAAPTTDPEVLRQREEERARWNVEYGKVLSNTATAEEIDNYYGEQQRLSEDYLAFLVYLRDHYASVIPQKDVGLLKLAGEMHLARLEEIPRKIAEAHERRKAHEAARQAWLADQKVFGDDPPRAPDPSYGDPPTDPE